MDFCHQSDSLQMTASYIAPIKRRNNVHILQGDLDMLGIWEETWQMDFNPSKCHVLHVSRSLDPTYDEYSLRGQTLDTVEEATFLGVTSTSMLLIVSVKLMILRMYGGTHAILIYKERI